MSDNPSKTQTILITGAAGNLGSLLARHLLSLGSPLRLMYHQRPLPQDLAAASQVTPVHGDLAKAGMLRSVIDGANVIVHFAGVLFAPRPGRFLPETNTRWFANLLGAALNAGVERVVLISFPHVEGQTSFERPATGRLEGFPISVHARTRLEEERLLMERTEGTATTPVILRLGMIYGRGILMIDAARWLARRRLLYIWREPTWIQLLSATDFLNATQAAIFNAGVRGIYHVGDEQPVTLQRFLDEACATWGCAPPPRMPVWAIFSAAALCELFAMLLRTPSPLTRDFIRIGRVSYWGDTGRAREELIPRLAYPNLSAGLSTL